MAMITTSPCTSHRLAYVSRCSLFSPARVTYLSFAGEWNLQIMDVRLEDDGEYQCQAGATATSRGIRSRVAIITVVSKC